MNASPHIEPEWKICGRSSGSRGGTGSRWRLAAFCAALAAWLWGGARLDGIRVSPDGTYRLEFYEPRRYQALIHAGMREPGYVLLYQNVAPYRNIRESAVVDFAGDRRVFWHHDRGGRILVGMGVSFAGVPRLVARRECPRPPCAR